MPSFPADVALLRPVLPHSHAGDCRPVLGPQQKVDSKAPQPVTAQWHPSKSVNMKSLQERGPLLVRHHQASPQETSKDTVASSRSALSPPTPASASASETEHGEALPPCKRSAHRTQV